MITIIMCRIYRALDTLTKTQNTSPKLKYVKLSSFRRDRPQTECTPEPSKPVHRNNTVSRITSKRSLFTGPKVLGGVDTASFLSTPGYSDKTPQTYLQQCFQTTQVLGEGSFGKVIILIIFTLLINISFKSYYPISCFSHKN